MQIFRLTEENIDQSLMTKIESLSPGCQYVVYRYETGFYDGNGELIGKTKEGKFFFQDIGHCSWYSPEDNITEKTFKECFDTLEELLIKTSEGWKREFSRIIEKVKELESLQN
jgi:hypothetical protein